MRHLYYLQKAFEFRMLWKGKNLLAKFQRLASESARGIGRLNGAVQLTELLQKAKDLKYKAAMCFTNNMYATDIHKWSFDSVKNEEVSMLKESAVQYYFSWFSLLFVTPLSGRGLVIPAFFRTLFLWSLAPDLRVSLSQTNTRHVFRYTG